MWIVAVIPTDPSGRRKIDHHEARCGIVITIVRSTALREHAPDLLRQMRHLALTTSERVAVARSLVGRFC